MSEERKKEILRKSIDADQLNQVVGGAADYIADGDECTNVSKRNDCQATVELGSSCWSNDACYVWDCEYSGCSRAEVDTSL